MKREPGYYWVKGHRPTWVIMQWQIGRWYAIGNSDETFQDDELSEINETRLTSPAESQGEKIK
jgi:hypothetical protein